METYKKIFCDIFEIEESQVEELTYQSIDAWDSVGHMELIAAIEDAYGIMMETDDIIELGSFKMGIDILKKYDINIE